MSSRRYSNASNTTSLDAIDYLTKDFFAVSYHSTIFQAFFHNCTQIKSDLNSGKEYCLEFTVLPPTANYTNRKMFTKCYTKVPDFSMILDTSGFLVPLKILF